MSDAPTIVKTWTAKDGARFAKFSNGQVVPIGVEKPAGEEPSWRRNEPSAGWVFKHGSRQPKNGTERSRQSRRIADNGEILAKSILSGPDVLDEIVIQGHLELEDVKDEYKCAQVFGLLILDGLGMRGCNDVAGHSSVMEIVQLCEADLANAPPIAPASAVSALCDVGGYNDGKAVRPQKLARLALETQPDVLDRLRPRQRDALFVMVLSGLIAPAVRNGKVDGKHLQKLWLELPRAARTVFAAHTHEAIAALAELGEVEAPWPSRLAHALVLDGELVNWLTHEANNDE